MTQRVSERSNKPSQWPAPSVIKWLIVVGIVASLAHFAHNALEIGNYPEPSWITPGIVLFAWIPNAVVAGVALVRKIGDLAFAIFAAMFGVLMLTGLAHYLYGSPIHIPDLSNLTILFEALSGVALHSILGRSLAVRTGGHLQA